jgi:hypothetical protein
MNDRGRLVELNFQPSIGCVILWDTVSRLIDYIRLVSLYNKWQNTQERMGVCREGGPLLAPASSCGSRGYDKGAGRQDIQMQRITLYHPADYIPNQEIIISLFTTTWYPHPCDHLPNLETL